MYWMKEADGTVNPGDTQDFNSNKKGNKCLSSPSLKNQTSRIRKICWLTNLFLNTNGIRGYTGRWSLPAWCYGLGIIGGKGLQA